MTQYTSITPRTKRCSRGENCIHPIGPYLPVTEEYWYLSNGKPGAMCRLCHKLYRREHHKQNKEYDNARSREYARRNGDKYSNYRANYYAKKRENGGKYTHEELDTVYRRQHGCCIYCGDFVGLTFDIDHYIPVSRGGTEDIENIVIACPDCNGSKRDKLVEEWGGK